ncbi:FeoB-associated Cys-rich membrane protein [Desulfosarcina sp. OttesenSCG-928-B08]|nr:FeoB-associated Cys-rich membrane protein [Desulfosarcina sp. OttesenSCG-928-B08]
MAEILIIGIIFLCAVAYLARRFFKTTRSGGCGCDGGCGCSGGKCASPSAATPPHLKDNIP